MYRYMKWFDSVSDINAWIKNKYIIDLYVQYLEKKCIYAFFFIRRIETKDHLYFISTCQYA